MLNVKTLAALGLSVAFASTLVAPVMATPLFGGGTENTNRNNNSQGQGQDQGQAQGQLQGQGQGQAQGQNSTNLNGNRNNNTNLSGSSSRSGAAAGASTDGSVVNDIGATSNSATNQGGSLSNTVEGDEFTTIILPDPVQLSPAQNTQPGMEVSCADLAIRADYTGGNTTGVTLYVISFYGQNTPSDLPAEMQEGFKSVVVCGLSNQLLRIVHNSDLEGDIKAAAQRLVIDQIFYNLYETNGMEYNPRALDLESVNLTPPVTLPLLN